MTIYIIRNHLDQYLGKQQEWLDQPESKLLFQTKEHDDAINTVFELSSKDEYLRCTVIETERDEKGQIHISDETQATD